MIGAGPREVLRALRAPVPVELVPVELTPVELTPVELVPIELTPVEPVLCPVLAPPPGTAAPPTPFCAAAAGANAARPSAIATAKRAIGGRLRVVIEAACLLERRRRCFGSHIGLAARWPSLASDVGTGI
jgi:hypothetical protein